MNINLQGLDKLQGIQGLEQLFEGDLRTSLATFGALAVFIAIIGVIIVVLCYVFSSIGLMDLAKKNKVSNPWLAFIPVGRSYIIGKLGFEVYDKENKNATTFMWITLGLGAASFALGNSNGDLHTLVEYGLLFFESWAFYNIFKTLNPKNSIVFTVFTVLSGTLLGGIFLYFMKSNDEKTEYDVTEANVIEEKKTEGEEVKKGTKKETAKNNFCQNCGAKITKDAKFCPECGKKIN